jgi:hypothetical protein
MTTKPTRQPLVPPGTSIDEPKPFQEHNGIKKTTSFTPSDSPLLPLEAAAAGQDEQAFWQASREIDWNRMPAADIARAVELALMAGAYTTARQLATNGYQRFPNHTRLQKMAHILAAPEATTVKSEDRAVWQANRQWLRTHQHEYRGKWVALRNGELLGVADSPADLSVQLGEIKGKGIFLTLA